MNLETVAAVLPPVNWPLETLKIFGPAIVALTAAYLGFQLANRGRKYEILYRERYKSFEELAGFLYQIKDHCESYLNRDTPGHREMPHYVPQFAKEVCGDLYPLHQKQPNKRHLILLGSKTRAVYNSTILLLDVLIRDVNEYIPTQAEQYGKYVHENMAGAHFEEILVIVRKLLNETDEAIRLAFKDIDLPRR